MDEQLWPNARRSAVNGKSVPIAWVDTNPLLLQLPTSGSWIMAENAGTEAVFSTSINADHARQETWIQVASSGDVDLLVNGHLITPAIPSSTRGKQLPHLAAPSALRQVKALRKRNQAPAPMRLRLQPKRPRALRQLQSLRKRNQRSAAKRVRLQVRQPLLFLSRLFCTPMTSVIG